MPILKNPRHEAFAQFLAKGQPASEAYVSAGYKESRPAASRLSTNVNVKKRVAELVARGADRTEITVARVLKELARLSFADIRQAFDEKGNLLDPSEWSDDFAASVSSIEVVTRSLPGKADKQLDSQPHGGALARRRNAKVEYVTKIKVWDKNSALEKIAKHLGLFVDRIEHGVTGEVADLLKAINGRTRGLPNGG